MGEESTIERLFKSMDKVRANYQTQIVQRIKILSLVTGDVFSTLKRYFWQWLRMYFCRLQGKFYFLWLRIWICRSLGIYFCRIWCVLFRNWGYISLQNWWCIFAELRMYFCRMATARFPGRSSRRCVTISHQKRCREFFLFWFYVFFKCCPCCFLISFLFSGDEYQV